MIREGGGADGADGNGVNVLKQTQFSTITADLPLTFRACALLVPATGSPVTDFPIVTYSLALGTNVLAKGRLRLKAPSAGAVGGLTPNDIIWDGTMPPGNLSLTFSGLAAAAAGKATKAIFDVTAT